MIVINVKNKRGKQMFLGYEASLYKLNHNNDNNKKKDFYSDIFSHKAFIIYRIFDVSILFVIISYRYRYISTLP